MGFLKGWKMKNINSESMSPVKTPAAFSPSHEPLPEDNLVKQVKPAEQQMTKFNGLKRRLAHFRNGFKDSTDKSEF